MPAIYSGARSANLKVSRKAPTRLRRYAKPRNMDRLLAVLYADFEENGAGWISVEDLLQKVKDEAQGLGDTLGKRSLLFCRICLHTLRKNSYIEYKPFDDDDETDYIRIREKLTSIFEIVTEAIECYNGYDSERDLHRIKCDYLRSMIQPKSRRLPTRAELDRENMVLEQENHGLVQMNKQLDSELEDLKRSFNTLRPDSGSLQRQNTVLIDSDRPESTPNSSLCEPIIEAQVQPSVVPVEISAVAQSLTRQITLQTPVRNIPADAASCYPSPESPTSNHVQRQASSGRIVSPLTSPRSRSREPSVFTMPGGVLDITLFGDEVEQGEGEEALGDNSMDVEEAGDGEHLVMRSITPDPTEDGSQAGASLGATPIRFQFQTTCIEHPHCAECAARQEEEETQNRTNNLCLQTCRECEEKARIIDQKNVLIEEQKGSIQDQKTFIDDLIALVLGKNKQIRTQLPGLGFT